MNQVVAVGRTSGMMCAFCKGKITGAYGTHKVVPVRIHEYTYYVRVHAPDCPPEPSVRRF